MNRVAEIWQEEWKILFKQRNTYCKLFWCVNVLNQQFSLLPTYAICSSFDGNFTLLYDQQNLKMISSCMKSPKWHRKWQFVQKKFPFTISNTEIWMMLYQRSKKSDVICISLRKFIIFNSNFLYLRMFMQIYT